MHTLTRYILRRWSLPLLGALLFYGLLLVANETVGISKEIFSQGAPLRWLLPLLGTSLPEIFGMVLPMAAVLGGVLGTQHLLEGSELVAAQGLGAGSRTWIRPWSILAVCLMVLAAFNAHYLVPAMSGVQNRIRARMADEARTRFLRPGAPPWFPPSQPGTAIWVDAKGELHLMESGPTGLRHIVASSMSYALMNKPDGSSTVEIRLQDLQGVLLQPQGDAVVHLRQEQQTLRFDLPSAAHLLPPTPLRNRPTAELLGNPDVQAKLELSRRIALPLASAALLLLGIALGFGHPRFYRGGAIPKSMGVIIVYYLLLKFFENAFATGKSHTVLPQILLPFAFLAVGWWVFSKRLKPHHSSHLWGKIRKLFRPLRKRWAPLLQALARLKEGLLNHRRRRLSSARGIFRRWAVMGWWRNWFAAFGTLLLLDFLVEYANLASDLSQNKVPFRIFFTYWLWKLPPFLAVVLPVAFLLGSLLALSEAALNREWVALKSGGISLVQWTWKAKWAWGPVLALTFLMQTFVAPRADGESDRLWRLMLKRSNPVTEVRPWLYLGSTGVLWNLHSEERWGFPLKSPGEAPILLHWRNGDPYSEALAWDGLRMVQGPAADRLFPDRALREAPTPEQATTLDLFTWQKWAPDPERAHLLWTRLLGWLAGPCLVLALLSYAFPGPRQGRGQTIGFGLAGGLVFLGLQTLFGGAARAGELPPLWGVIGPMFLLLGFGLLRTPRLKT